MGREKGWDGGGKKESQQRFIVSTACYFALLDNEDLGRPFEAAVRQSKAHWPQENRK